MYKASSLSLRCLRVTRLLSLLLAALLFGQVLLPFAPARADAAPVSSLALAIALHQAEKTAPAKAVSAPTAANRLSYRLANTPYVAPSHSLKAAVPLKVAVPQQALPPNPPKPFVSVTLLNEVGKLLRPLLPATVAAWKTELHTAHPKAGRTVLLHLWLGEWELAQNQQPRKARALFAQVQHQTSAQDKLHGVAAYDTAMAMDYAGMYEASSDAFSHLLKTPHSAGFSREDAMLWLRHVEACAGYHAAHAAIGIPEPPQLDPECGAAALAACLRGLSLPYDRKTILSACRVTGEGSSLQDVLQAAHTLGLTSRALTADDAGLMALPKPLVAYVEKDHFVALVRADKQGVSYLCSDCGMWPGGRVNLTWRQWHTMEPGLYAAVTRPGSAWDRLLADVPDDASGQAAAGRVKIASASLFPTLGLSRLQAFWPRLLGHVVRVAKPAGNVGCGTSPACLPCLFGGNSPLDNPLVEAAGPSSGDPVNLATGQEEYSPAPDLTVYNPVGPSVVWQRGYESLRGPGQTRAENYIYDGTYQSDDFGVGWSQPYNIGVIDTIHAYTAGSRSVLFANGGKLVFDPPASGATVPTSGSPVFYHSHVSGEALLLEWDYDATSSGHFQVIFQDRTRWITGALTAPGSVCPLTQIMDRNGNSIYFNYGATLSQSESSSGWPLLSTITTQPNGGGVALLTIARSTTTDVNGRPVPYIVSVSDCYGRSVSYQASQFNNPNCYYGPYYNELTHVSQVVPTGRSMPADRWAYGYQAVGNGEGAEQVNYLHTITVPSPSVPSQTGLITSYIWYGNLQQDSAGLSNPNYQPVSYANTQTGGSSPFPYVSALVDGNGNQRLYTSVNASGAAAFPSNNTQVVVKNSGGTTVYAYSVSYDGNLNELARTDGANHAVSTIAYDPIDQYKPSSVTDGNSQTTTYTWDAYGNMVTMTPPTSSVRTPAATTYHVAYTSFALGELTDVTTGSKTPTHYDYYEPSGLVKDVLTPVAGYTGGSNRSTTSYTYDNLGNVLTLTAPGNSTTSAITTTFGYTSDGSYSQPDAIGQPVTVTDNLSHVTHLRYDSRGNLLSVVDALGLEHDYSYNIANQPLQALDPATHQTGSGQCSQMSFYQYPGGPLSSVATYDESGNSSPMRQVNYAYGLEGETRSVSGSTEPVSYAYDALYRLVTLTDGGAHKTAYFYNAAGYLYQVAYPGATASMPTSPLTAGTYDTMTFPSYYGNGNVKTRVDGNNVTTTYTYNDPQSLLTNIAYTYPSGYGGGTTANVGLSYDTYGRRASMTDGTGSATYLYDDGNRPTQVSTSYSGLPSALTVLYYYNADGSRLGMSTPAGSFSYGYDAAGRETSLSNPQNEATQWTYLNNNWLQTQKLANSVTTTYSYNQRGLMIDQTTKTYGGALLSEYGGFGQGASMTYDGAGNRLFQPANMPASPAAYSGTTNYTYDYGQTANPALNRSQLTGEQSSRAGSYNVQFTYDSGSTSGPGNPTTFRGASRSYNSDNQDTRNAYDGNGNTGGYSTGSNTYISLSFDPENRLTQYGSAVTNTYTGDGLRAKKAFSGGAYYWFVYDGSLPVCEVDGSGNVTALSTWGANGLVSRRSNNATWLYSFDPSGNGSLLLDSNANIIASSVADGFGNTYTNATGDPYFGFGGQWGYYYDAQDGLHLLGHRFYDRSAGRFLTRDPLGYRGGINLYAYTQNDPVNRADPNGFCSFLLLYGAMGGGGLFGLGGGYSGAVGTGFDTNGNVGDVVQGAAYGSGASRGGGKFGGIVEQSGPGVSFSTGDLNTGFEPTVNNTTTIGPITIDVAHPITGGETTVSITAGEGEGYFNGTGAGAVATIATNVGTIVRGIVDGIVQGVYNQYGQ